MCIKQVSSACGHQKMVSDPLEIGVMNDCESQWVLRTEPGSSALTGLFLYQMTHNQDKPSSLRSLLPTFSMINYNKKKKKEMLNIKKT